MPNSFDVSDRHPDQLDGKIHSHERRVESRIDPKKIEDLVVRDLDDVPAPGI